MQTYDEKRATKDAEREAKEAAERQAAAAEEEELRKKEDEEAAQWMNLITVDEVWPLPCPLTHNLFAPILCVIRHSLCSVS
jgi:hypothetical protein